MIIENKKKIYKIFVQVFIGPVDWGIEYAECLPRKKAEFLLWH